MKHWNRAILSAFLVVLSVGAYCQESNLVAKCLGQAWSAYAKAFGNDPTWKKGGATVNEYKTGSAKIEVIQSPGAKVPNLVNLYFYQEPKYDWKLALKVAGLSPAGVVAKEDSKHRVHLSHVRAAHAVIVEAVFVPMNNANPDGPELHLKLKAK